MINKVSSFMSTQYSNKYKSNKSNTAFGQTKQIVDDKIGVDKLAELTAKIEFGDMKFKGITESGEQMFVPREFDADMFRVTTNCFDKNSPIKIKDNNGTIEIARNPKIIGIEASEKFNSFVESNKSSLKYLIPNYLRV